MQPIRPETQNFKYTAAVVVNNSLSHVKKMLIRQTRTMTRLPKLLLAFLVGSFLVHPGSASSSSSSPAIFQTTAATLIGNLTHYSKLYVSFDNCAYVHIDF